MVKAKTSRKKMAIDRKNTGLVWRKTTFAPYRPRCPKSPDQIYFSMFKDLLELLGRACLATIFVFQAYDSIAHFSETKASMDRYGITWNQYFLVRAAIVFLILGALMLITGYRAKFGAWLLLAYWLPVTFLVHDWWNVAEPRDRHFQSILFMTDLAVIGGLLMVAVNGAGRYSIRRLFATTRVRTFF